METRVRTRSQGTYVGYIKYTWAPDLFEATCGQGSDYCEDVIGRYPLANPFFSEKFHLNPGTFSGKQANFPVFEYIGTPYTNQPVAGHGPLPSSPSSDGDSALDMLARTNPSNATVSIPNFIYELKDLPRMLFLSGDRHRKTGRRNSSVVEYNFGWELLFQDLSKILDFTAHAEQRRRELQSLNRSGNLRRRRTTWRDAYDTFHHGTAFHSGEFGAFGTRKVATNGHRWVSAKWQAAQVPDYPGLDLDTLRNARRLVHGWSLSPSTIWDALPWSWLVDYFLPVGNFLKAHNNQVGATATNVCVMTEIHTTVTDEVTSYTSGFTIKPASSKYVTRNRALVDDLTPDASFPVLSGKQLLNLSSIMLNRGG